MQLQQYLALIPQVLELNLLSLLLYSVSSRPGVVVYLNEETQHAFINFADVTELYKGMTRTQNDLYKLGCGCGRNRCGNKREALY